MSGITWFVLLAPIGVMIPGPIGEIFRAIKAILAVAALSFMIIFAWVAATVYYGGACMVTSSPYHCQEAYELGMVPVNMWGVFWTTKAPDPKKTAEINQRNAANAARERAETQAVVDRYNARMAQQRH